MNNYKYIAINDTIQLLVATTDKMSASTSNSNNNYDGIYLKVLASIFYSISMLLGVGGNALVLLIVLYYQRMHTVTNFFIVNLAISDLIFALLCIPITYITAYILQYWPFSSFLCIFFNYMQNVSVTLTVYTLIWITIDKYWAVVKPLKLRMSITMCKVLISISWLFSFFISIPIALFTKLSDPSADSNNNNNSSSSSSSSSLSNSSSTTTKQQTLTNDQLLSSPPSHPNCIENWPTDLTLIYNLYNFALFFIQYFIPLIIITFCYARIGFVLRKTKAPGESIQNRDARMLQSKQKLIKMCFMMVVTFVFAWAPMQILNIYRFYDENITNASYFGDLFFVCHWLAVSRSFICPIIYAWTNLRFREGFKYLLCCGYYYEKKMGENTQSSEIIRMKASFKNSSIRTFASRNSFYGRRSDIALTNSYMNIHALSPNGVSSSSQSGMCRTRFKSMIETSREVPVNSRVENGDTNSSSDNDAVDAKRKAIAKQKSLPRDPISPYPMTMMKKSPSENSYKNNDDAVSRTSSKFEALKQRYENSLSKATSINQIKNDDINSVNYSLNKNNFHGAFQIKDESEYDDNNVNELTNLNSNKF